MFFAGVDIGAAFTKALVLGDQGPVAYSIIPSGGDYAAAARKAVAQALGEAGLAAEALRATVATGVGAPKAPWAQVVVSDITCQGWGVHHLFPEVRTIIDIGGQATKVVKVDGEGRALDFVINEKCAAGSGRFLQVIARVLRLDFQDLGPLSLQARNPVEFSTGCAVFAESEAVSRIAEGARKEDLLAGVHQALAAKVFSLVQRVGLEKEIALTGGGAKDTGLVRSLEEQLKLKLWVPPEPQITAALGAALLARGAAHGGRPARE